ncbi:hypothetical protein D3C86_2082090 [compost metagenome]
MPLAYRHQHIPEGLVSFIQGIEMASAAVPGEKTVSDMQTYYVHSFLQMLRDVKDNILRTTVIVRPTRVHLVVPDFSTVHVQVEVP